MKFTAFLTAGILLALPLAAQTPTQTTEQTQLRKRDGSGSGTPAQSQLRKRDGSCGNPNPAGSRGAGQGQQKGRR